MNSLRLALVYVCDGGEDPLEGWYCIVYEGEGRELVSTPLFSTRQAAEKEARVWCTNNRPDTKVVDT